MKTKVVVGWIVGVAIFLAVGYLGSLKCGYIPDTYHQFVIAALVIGPLCLIVEIVFRDGLSELFRYLGFHVGRFVVYCASFGKLKFVDGISTKQFPWHGVKRANDGALIVGRDFVVSAGVIAISLLMFVGLAVGAGFESRSNEADIKVPNRISSGKAKLIPIRTPIQAKECPLSNLL